MKKGWKVVKIPDVLSFQEGPGVRKHQFTSEGVKLLNVGNINNGQIDLSKTKMYISKQEAFGKYKHFLVDDGDLVIASSGIVVNNFHNKIAFIKEEHLPLCMNTSTIRFKALNDEVIDLNYFRYFLKTKFFADQLQRLITGSAQLNFGPSHLKKIDLVLPPLEDQKRIVKILDEADALRQKRKQAIGLLDYYLKSVFLEMFGDPVKNPMGWEIKTLKNLTTKLGDGLHGTPKFSDTGDYYFVNGNNLEHGKILIKDSTKRVSLEEYKKYKKSLDGTSMLVSINGTLGRVAFYKNEKIILGKSACYFNVKKDEVNSVYLYNILQSDFFLKYADQNSTGSTIKNVSLKTMREFPVIYPPINMQNIFGDIVAKTEKVKASMFAQSAELEVQFQALMQKAFKGEDLSPEKKAVRSGQKND